MTNLPINENNEEFVSVFLKTDLSEGVDGEYREDACDCESMVDGYGNDRAVLGLLIRRVRADDGHHERVDADESILRVYVRGRDSLDRETNAPSPDCNRK